MYKYILLVNKMLFYEEYVQQMLNENDTRNETLESEMENLNQTVITGSTKNSTDGSNEGNGVSHVQLQQQSEPSTNLQHNIKNKVPSGKTNSKSSKSINNDTNNVENDVVYLTIMPGYHNLHYLLGDTIVCDKNKENPQSNMAFIILGTINRQDVTINEFVDDEINKDFLDKNKNLFNNIKDKIIESKFKNKNETNTNCLNLFQSCIKSYIKCGQNYLKNLKLEEITNNKLPNDKNQYTITDIIKPLKNLSNDNINIKLYQPTNIEIKTNNNNNIDFKGGNDNKTRDYYISLDDHLCLIKKKKNDTKYKLIMNSIINIYAILNELEENK